MNEIMWPRAKYWDGCANPVIGCHKVSPACEHCYAEASVKRFNMTGCDCKDFKPTDKPLCKWPRKGIVFAFNMSDVCGEWITEERAANYFFQAKEITQASKWCKYLFLTKRVHKMHEAYKRLGVPYTKESREAWKHVWFGMTAENQEWYDNRLAHFIYEDNTWLSAEPLLGPIDLHFDEYEGKMGGMPFRWVVVGCESGLNRRLCNLEWVRDIVKQCRDHGVPVFVKQLEIFGKCVTDIYKFPEDLRIRQMPFDIPVDLFAKASPAWTL